MTERRDPATPTSERCLTSYPVRRLYKPGAVYPPQVPGVAGAIDIHCHAHSGQQDALALAKLASINGMRGILFKSLRPMPGPAGHVQGLRKLQADLQAWSDETGIAPVECWVGWGLTRDNKAPTLEKIARNVVEGVAGVWLPIANHANTYFKVGGKPIWWDANADPRAHTGPLPWDEALKVGFYMLDGNKRLKREFAEAIRAVADADVALFFGHATHAEIFEVAELVNKLGIKRAVIDHPFSPFVDLSAGQMKDLGAAGIYLNFTYDEISPLLGVDPAVMYETIREIGVEHCTLSSDAGEPLFPNSVECMRMMRGYMEAFGMSADELDILCNRNPAAIAGAAQSHAGHTASAMAR